MVDHMIVQKLLKACTKAGMREDVLAVFPEQHADKFERRAVDGKLKIRTKDGSKKVGAWLAEQRATLPSLFADPVEPDIDSKKSSNPWHPKNFSLAAQSSLTQALIKKHGKEEGENRARAIARSVGSFYGAVSPKSKPMTASYARTATGRPERV